MTKPMDRRKFVKRSLAATAGATLTFRFEDRALLAAQSKKATDATRDSAQDHVAGQAQCATGKIGKLDVTRLICGGNLTSGFAHSRDLMYVSPLLRHYFTDQKIFETWQLCEQHGVNATILRVDDTVIRLMNTYRKRYGGKLQWIAQVKPRIGNLTGDIERAMDNGAVGAYIQGGVGDTWIKENRIDLMAKTVEFIKNKGLIAGIGGHSIDVPISCEASEIESDFYMKTINSKSYWSAGPMPRHDSVWAETPEITVDFMKEVKKPWIGFKVLGAGAIHPREGFRYAFEKGADFICVGMFDFQVVEDVHIARGLFAENVARQRPWCA